MMTAGRNGNKQDVWVKPPKFFLLAGGPYLYTKHTVWSSWGKYSATGSGPMYGADLTTSYVGYVTLRFSDRKTNAHFVGTSKRFSYFENVHVVGPGARGLAGHGYWHWSWSRHGWIPNGAG